MSAVTFEVIGEPVPQGSVSSRILPGTQRSVTYYKNAKNIHEYRGQLAAAAVAAGAERVEAGAIEVQILFVFSRITAHFGTGRNAGIVKDSAPYYVTKANHDIDKLTRCVLDALTGVCYRDDGQVAVLHCTKRYTLAGVSERPRTVVTVSVLAEEGGR